MRLQLCTDYLKSLFAAAHPRVCSPAPKRRNQIIRSGLLEELEPRTLLTAQVISAVPSSAAVAPSSPVSVTVFYQTQTDAGVPVNQQSSGIDVKLFFDSHKLTAGLTTKILVDGLVPVTAGVKSDTQNLDGNAATDDYLEFSYHKSNNNFLPQAAVPVALLTVNFQTTENLFTGTQLDFTGVTNGFTFKSAPVNLVNPAPFQFASLSASPNPIVEGNLATLLGTFTDANFAGPHTADIDWGDRSPHSTVQIPAGQTNLNATHTYLVDNPVTAPSPQDTIRVTLSSPLQTIAASTQLEIDNAKFEILSITTSPGSAKRSVNVVVNFSDLGPNDKHLARFGFGDGSSAKGGAINEVTQQATVSHTYRKARTFTIGVTLIDEAGNAVQATTTVVVPGRQKTAKPLRTNHRGG